MADRIGVIAHGRLIAEGTLEELHRQARRMADDAGAAGGGAASATLEDAFLALVAESAAAA
jgi:ABC-2 type transport system ATP-binding protein